MRNRCSIKCIHNIECDGIENHSEYCQFSKCKLGYKNPYCTIKIGEK